MIVHTQTKSNKKQKLGHSKATCSDHKKSIFFLHEQIEWPTQADLDKVEDLPLPDRSKLKAFWSPIALKKRYAHLPDFKLKQVLEYAAKMNVMY